MLQIMLFPKQHLATQEKYYLVDLGFRNALFGKELASDTGHLFENITYLELKHRNNQIWIRKPTIWKLILLFATMKVLHSIYKFSKLYKTQKHLNVN